MCSRLIQSERNLKYKTIQTKGFGRACGATRSVVPMLDQYKALLIQVHNGMRSIVASGMLRGFKPASRMACLVSI